MFREIMHHLFTKPVYLYEEVSVSSRDDGVYTMKVSAAKHTLEKLNLHLRQKAYAYLSEQSIFDKDASAESEFSISLKILATGEGHILAQARYPDQKVSKDLVCYLRDCAYSFLTGSLAETGEVVSVEIPAVVRSGRESRRETSSPAGLMHGTVLNAGHVAA